MCRCLSIRRQYFPPVPEADAKPTDPAEEAAEIKEEAEKEAAEEAEAETLASELPDVPKTDPDAEGRVEKKQKQEP